MTYDEIVDGIEANVATAKVMRSENGRISHGAVFYRERYRFADGRICDVCRDKGQNDRIVEYWQSAKPMPYAPKNWQVEA